MATKIERAWKNKNGSLETSKEISEDRANRELANAHGDQAVVKLKKEKRFETRFGVYTIAE